MMNEDRNKVIEENNSKKKEDEYQTLARKNGRSRKQVWNQKVQTRINDNNQFDVLKDQVEDEKEDQKIDNLQDSNVGANKKGENKEAGLESALVIWNSEMIKEKRDDHLVSSEGEGEILKVSDDDVQVRKEEAMFNKDEIDGGQIIAGVIFSFFL
ncbi:hypothetical protein HAX54_009916 [Datura stramonium]|uniref:Uncharacterized protein n=1 Tax=Datura stramonium TaxID=4076 RepID=A0ABS8RWM0_DATST|nr:hypothetical protein [Datura stramonium]